MNKEKEKEKTGIEKNLTLIVIILVAGLIVLLFNSQELFQDSSPNSILSENILKNNTNITKETNITDKDKDFNNWLYLSFGSILSDLECISQAGKNKNFSDTELCGKLLKDDSNRYLTQIGLYNVSSSLQITLDEYRKSLEDYNIGGEKLETGARNKNIAQMVEASDYIRNGTSRANYVMNVLYENNNQIKTKI